MVFHRAQASILGLLLFIVYINDIIHVSDIADMILFADDTNMFFSHSSFDTLVALVNDELSKISKWFRLNKLSLNVKKTNYILFRSKRKIINDKGANIAIDGLNLLEVRKTKFLGVVINQTLTWNDHIMLIKQKVAKNVGILTRVRYCVPRCVLLSLYHALIEPYLMYCNIVWATHNTVVVNSLFLYQKRVVRIISFSYWLSHTKPIFAKYRILTVCDINRLQIACFMYGAMHNLIPQYFGAMFTLNSNVHSYLTRQNNDFHLAKFKSNISKFNIRVQGPLLWNSLPTELRTLPHLGLFKRHCKMYLLQHQ